MPSLCFISTAGAAGAQAAARGRCAGSRAAGISLARASPSIASASPSRRSLTVGKLWGFGGPSRGDVRARAGVDDEVVEPEDFDNKFDQLAKEMQAEVEKQMQMQMDANKKSVAETMKAMGVDVNEVEVAYDPTSKMTEWEGEMAEDKRKSALTLFSPSKINLFLRVTARRDDGFHDLASLFHVIDLGDTIKFSVSPSKTKDAITTNDPDVPLDDSNLIIKALNKFREKTGSEQFYWIHLDKRVPSGAGLGGGSANASTALWAANQMCGELATEEQLLEWSGEVGSDCPVFFSTGAAYCTGRGEIVENVPPPLSLATPMLLVKPSYGCSTPAIFKALDLDSRSTADPQDLLDRITKGASEEVCVNDLEAPAFSVVPELARLKKRLQAALRNKCDAVFMSGSGSTIVCMGSDEVPGFLYDEDGYEDVFISPARLLTRQPGEWYQPAEGYMNEAVDSQFAAQRGLEL